MPNKSCREWKWAERLKCSAAPSCSQKLFIGLWRHLGDTRTNGYLSYTFKAQDKPRDKAFCWRGRPITQLTITPILSQWNTGEWVTAVTHNKNTTDVVDNILIMLKEKEKAVDRNTEKSNLLLCEDINKTIINLLPTWIPFHQALYVVVKN